MRSKIAHTSTVALTRALVHRPKILVLDEATSSVDTATDKMIQRVVQSEFSSKGVTILSIAHRLETVAWFDKILVMDHGKIIEVSFLRPRHNS